MHDAALLNDGEMKNIVGGYGSGYEGDGYGDDYYSNDTNGVPSRCSKKGCKVNSDCGSSVCVTWSDCPSIATYGRKRCL